MEFGIDDKPGDSTGLSLTYKFIKGGENEINDI